MASNLFASSPSNSAQSKGRANRLTSRKTDTINGAGAPAYSKSDELALATLALTSTFGDGFYASANQQLTDLLKAADGVSDEFLAKAIVYADQQGKMKDVVAVLAVALSNRNSELFRRVFKIVQNPKFVRNFVQVVRSGTINGRKSLGSGPKKAINQWLDTLGEKNFLYATIGNAPSLKDIVALTHYRPSAEMQEAYKWLWGKEFNMSKMPSAIRQYVAFKDNREHSTREIVEFPSGVPFQMMTSLPLNDNDWKTLAKSMSWNQIRQNLNTMQRHNVFNDEQIVDLIAAKLDSQEDVNTSKVFPHALMAAYDATAGVPNKIRNSIQNCIDYAFTNIPAFNGKRVIVAVDFSGSMSAPVTGHRGSATSVVRCIDVAAMFAAAIAKNNPDATLMRFDDNAQLMSVNTRDSVATIQKQIVANGGGTNCASPVQLANQKNIHADVFIILSDNESWSGRYNWDGTPLNAAWKMFQQKNPDAKLVVCDLAPNRTVQVPSSNKVLAVGGYSDSFFTVVDEFVFSRETARVNLVQDINSVVLA